MGIIVLALAVLPRLRVGGRPLLENESPGPEFDKLAPRIGDTAKRLWLLYVGITAVQALVLRDRRLHRPRRPAWTSTTPSSHAFTAMATGGFSPEPRSIEPFGAWAQWVLVLLHVRGRHELRALVPRPLPHAARWFLRDEEFRLYVALLARGERRPRRGCSAATSSRPRGSIRHAVFQVGHDHDDDRATRRPTSRSGRRSA